MTSERLVDQTLVGHTHGAAGDAELSRQIPPGRQPRAGGKPPCLDGTSDRLVDLRGQRRLSSTIDIDGDGGHRTMVQSELPILVLFYDQGGTHLFVRTSGQSTLMQLQPFWMRPSKPKACATGGRGGSRFGRLALRTQTSAPSSVEKHFRREGKAMRRVNQTVY